MDGKPFELGQLRKKSAQLKSRIRELLTTLEDPAAKSSLEDGGKQVRDACAPTYMSSACDLLLYSARRFSWNVIERMEHNPASTVCADHCAHWGRFLKGQKGLLL